MDALAAFAERIETVFADIAATRMQGVPVMNPHLGVSMCGLRRHGEHHVGVLVTPWFMSVLVLPLVQPEVAGRIGAQRGFVLPSGRYDAMLCHEPALGHYWSCSLFSPMWEFVDMESAVATADASLDLLFAVPDAQGKGDAGDVEDFREAMVQPAAARSVEQRLEEEAAPESALNVQDAPVPGQIDRRALFGLRRHEGAQAS